MKKCRYLPDRVNFQYVDTVWKSVPKRWVLMARAMKKLKEYHLFQAIPKEGITMFASTLHTHDRGVSVRTQHLRNHTEIGILPSDDFYDPFFQEVRTFEKTVTALPVSENFVLLLSSKLIISFYFSIREITSSHPATTTPRNTRIPPNSDFNLRKKCAPITLLTTPS